MRTARAARNIHMRVAGFRTTSQAGLDRISQSTSVPNVVPAREDLGVTYPASYRDMLSGTPICKLFDVRAFLSVSQVIYLFWSSKKREKPTKDDILGVRLDWLLLKRQKDHNDFRAFVL